MCRAHVCVGRIDAGSMFARGGLNLCLEGAASGALVGGSWLHWTAELVVVFVNFGVPFIHVLVGGDSIVSGA